MQDDKEKRCTDNLKKIEHDRLESELNRDKVKWRIRRRLAISSFYITAVICVYYLASPFFLVDNQAKMLADFNAVILTLVGTFISVVLVYIGATTYIESHNG